MTFKTKSSIDLCAIEISKQRNYPTFTKLSRLYFSSKIFKRIELLLRIELRAFLLRGKSTASARQINAWTHVEKRTQGLINARNIARASLHTSPYLLPSYRRQITFDIRNCREATSRRARAIYRSSMGCGARDWRGFAGGSAAAITARSRRARHRRCQPDIPAAASVANCVSGTGKCKKWLSANRVSCPRSAFSMRVDICTWHGRTSWFFFSSKCFSE